MRQDIEMLELYNKKRVESIHMRLLEQKINGETMIITAELTKKELIKKIRSTRKCLKAYKKLVKENKKVIKRAEGNLESLSKKLETGRYYEED